MLTAELTELFEFKLVGGLLLVLSRRVVLALTLSTIQAYNDSHNTIPCRAGSNIGTFGVTFDFPNGEGLAPLP